MSNGRSSWLAVPMILFLGFTHGQKLWNWWFPPPPETVYEQQHGPSDPMKAVRQLRQWLPGPRTIAVVGPGRGEWAGTLIDGAGDSVIAIGKWIARDPAQRMPTAALVLEVTDKRLDRYGNAAEYPVLRLSWQRDDLEKIRWETITSALVVQLAKLEMSHPSNRYQIRDWCARHRQLSLSLCEN